MVTGQNSAWQNGADKTAQRKYGKRAQIYWQNCADKTVQNVTVQNRYRQEELVWGELGNGLSSSPSFLNGSTVKQHHNDESCSFAFL